MASQNNMKRNIVLRSKTILYQESPRLPIGWVFDRINNNYQHFLCIRFLFDPSGITSIKLFSNAPLWNTSYGPFDCYLINILEEIGKDTYFVNLETNAERENASNDELIPQCNILMWKKNCEAIKALVPLGIWCKHNASDLAHSQIKPDPELVSTKSPSQGLVCNF